MLQKGCKWMQNKTENHFSPYPRLRKKLRKNCLTANNTHLLNSEVIDNGTIGLHKNNWTSLNLSAGQQSEHANNESMVKLDKKQIWSKLVKLPGNVYPRCMYVPTLVKSISAFCLRELGRGSKYRLVDKSAFWWSAFWHIGFLHIGCLLIGFLLIGFLL
jgi:hypothetical protein